jgi:CelD/BcsL family acetyltransferase involved in cellulose biosynthesis
MAAIIKIYDSIEPLTADWERLAENTEANPFLRPGYVSAWWQAFGRGQLRVFTVYEDDCLIGVLPMQIFHGALLGLTNPHTPLFGFLAAHERSAEQLAHALFFREPHRVELSYLAPTDIGVSMAHAAANSARYRVFTESVLAAPYVSTDKAWDVYESGLRRKFRSEIRRRRRRLEEQGRLTLEVSDGKDRLEELLEEGFKVEGLGWKEAYGTSINAHPATRHFYTQVARWAAERGWLRLVFLRLDGRALAFDYCLECQKTHYLIKTGYDPSYRRYAPGMIIRYLMLAQAFSNDIITYDFLGEDQEWKREWTSTQQERLFLRMCAPTALGSLDQAVFVYGRPAAEWVKNLARSMLSERSLHMLKRGRALGRAWVGR